MNPCIHIILLITISTSISLVVSASEFGQKKRLHIGSSSSNKRSKYDGLLTGNNVIINNENKIYVAVIGGGINAALFTHYLHDLIKAEVHIYNHGTIENPEKNSFIVHENQKYMMEIISKFNLDTLDLNQAVIMYDGHKNPVLNFHQIDPIKPFIEFYINPMIPKFEKIYDIQQKQLRSFKNLSTLLFNMSRTFPKLLKISTREFIMKKQQCKNLSNTMKIVHSLVLLNYGQNLECNAFAGLTSLIFSESTGKLKQITTPIDQVVGKLFSNNYSDLIVNLNISKVTYKEILKDIFRPQVSWMGEDGQEYSRSYDYVVIVTPEIDNIYFLGFENNIAVCKNRKMAFVTVMGSLKDDVFDNSNTMMEIANVKDSGSIRLANKISNLQWNVLADDDARVSTEISSIFNITGTVEVQKIAMQPDYLDKECAVKATFDLDTKLLYLNAIEWGSSLLEMKAIGAMNVALRIKKLKDQKRVYAQ